MIRNFTILFLLFIIGTASIAEQTYPFKEKDYQKAWCQRHNGILEYVLPDKTRVDCVTQTHAIEFDFAKKWGESIGQALYYGISLNKIPGIVLITTDPVREAKYVKRVETVAKKFGITLWTMTPNEIY